LATSRDAPVPREDRDLGPSTISVDTPGRDLRVRTSGSSEASVELFISGISSPTGEVVLNAHTFGSTPGLSHRWDNDGGVTRTCLSTDVSGSIYLVAGRSLRVLGSDFVPAAEFEVPSEPGGIEISRTTLWMAVRSPGRLARGELTLSFSIPTDIVWSEISLPAGSDPVALSSNQSGQVFVLDAGLRRVQVVSPDGEALFHWDLPDRPFDLGDIGVTARNEVYVLDNGGTIHSFLP